MTLWRTRATYAAALWNPRPCASTATQSTWVQRSRDLRGSAGCSRQMSGPGNSHRKPTQCRCVWAYLMESSAQCPSSMGLWCFWAGATSRRSAIRLLLGSRRAWFGLSAARKPSSTKILSRTACSCLCAPVCHLRSFPRKSKTPCRHRLRRSPITSSKRATTTKCGRFWKNPSCRRFLARTQESRSEFEGQSAQSKSIDPPNTQDTRQTRSNVR